MIIARKQYRGPWNWGSKDFNGAGIGEDDEWEEGVPDVEGSSGERR